MWMQKMTNSGLRCIQQPRVGSLRLHGCWSRMVQVLARFTLLAGHHNMKHLGTETLTSYGSYWRAVRMWMQKDCYDKTPSVASCSPNRATGGRTAADQAQEWRKFSIACARRNKVASTDSQCSPLRYVSSLVDAFETSTLTFHHCCVLL